MTAQGWAASFHGDAEVASQEGNRMLLLVRQFLVYTSYTKKAALNQFLCFRFGVLSRKTLLVSCCCDELLTRSSLQGLGPGPMGAEQDRLSPGLG